MRKGVAPALVALALAGVCGCSGGRPAPHDETLPPPVDRTREAQQMLADAMAGREALRIPRGYRVREDASGVSVAFPRHWQALRGPDARFPGVVETFGRYNPELALWIRALAVPGSPLVLVAFDPRTRDGYATNANLLVARARRGAAFSDWTPGVIRRVRRLHGLRGRVRAHHVSLAAGEALRLEFLRVYRSGQTRRRVAFLQYVLVRDDRTYALMYSTLPRLRSHYRRVFEASARTLSLPG